MTGVAEVERSTGRDGHNRRSARDAPPTAVAGGATRPTRLFVTFTLCFGVTLAWAAGTPMFGVPDEVSHMIRAAAAVRGDVDGRIINGERRYRALAVMEPGHRASSAVPVRGGVCYAGLRLESAGCLTFSADHGERELPSSAGSYPPAYYFLVGWPSLLVHGVRALYAMRAASSAVFAALLALATLSFPSGRRGAPAYVALAIAATPMVWFLGSSVTPSSAAVGAGIAAWCGGYRLVTGEDAHLARLAWRFGLPVSLLLLVRRDSIFWAGIIVAALAALSSPSQVRAMLKSRHVWFWALVSLGSAILAATSGGSYASSVVSAGGGGSARDAFGALLQYLQEMVGVLGWLDTALPSAVYVLWYALFGGLVAGLLTLGRSRVILVTFGVAVSVAAMIVLFGAQVFPYFQGRYALPAAVGVPLLAGFALVDDRVSVRLSLRPIAFALCAVWVINELAFYQQFRRYAKPGDPTWSLLGHVQWRPPTAPILFLVTVHVALVAALLLSFQLRTRGDGEAGAIDAAVVVGG